MSKKKSHARAADKKGFSVALPIELVDQVQAIANKETRSRNQQIEVFLKDGVTRYNKSKANPPLAALTKEQEAEADILHDQEADLERNEDGGEPNTSPAA